VSIKKDFRVSGACFGMIGALSTRMLACIHNLITGI
jgi:hypothetical protein